jgi:hypothetical protein
MLRVGIRPNCSTRVQASGHDLNPELLVRSVVFFTTRALVTGIPRSQHMNYALGDAACVASWHEQAVFLNRHHRLQIELWQIPLTH